MNLFRYRKHSPEHDRQRGQGMLEYVALTALVAIVCITTVRFFGGRVRTRLNQITTTFDRQIQQGLRTRIARNTHSPATPPMLPGQRSGPSTSTGGIMNVVKQITGMAPHDEDSDFSDTDYGEE